MGDDPNVAARGTDSKVLAEVYVEAATTDKPRRRYAKGAMPRPLMFTKKWLGDRTYKLMLRRLFRDCFYSRLGKRG
ncbi:MAG: hypothetical protein OXI96_06975 [Acidimicrobiaceae bacterium]|nr:hypothetical protein [Acidimicrobiaceae bacterium]